ncbi:CalY family protein [Candidatus Pacebacteria bacterium]|nr:CalY family protein [Candidatus Paceibacterota bacterium]
MNRIFLSAAFITFVVGVVSFGATKAFFNDTEVATANTFTAGDIDLQIDNESYYNGVFNEDTSWELVDLTIERFFDFDDVKPSDYGEDTISIHIDTNDAYLCANVTLTSNDENDCTEPEGEVDDSCGDPGEDEGELADLVNFLWWADDGDNVLEDDEMVISEGAIGDIGVGNTYPLTLADSDTNIWNEDEAGGPAPGDETLYIGKAWCFGDIAANPIAQDGEIDAMTPADDNDDNDAAGEPEDGGISCDGSLLGNESQTDSLTADISFEAVQARHNDDFQCAEPEEDRTTLTLAKELFSPNDAPEDFTLLADGPTDLVGMTGEAAVTNAAVEPGTYALSEVGPDGYDASVWNCVGGTQEDDDTITIAAGESVSCTIINYVACTDPNQQFADNVVSSEQGVRNDGSAINVTRTDPLQVLGAPESTGAEFDSPVVTGSFFSLGFNPDQNVNFEGGKIVIEFVDNFLIDGPGNDLRMWEVTGGSSYPVEELMIEVSQDNATWFPVASSLDRDAEADLANSGLAWARYVRLTDVSDRTSFEATADAYDLDAFSALTCADRTYLVN